MRSAAWLLRRRRQRQLEGRGLPSVAGRSLCRRECETRNQIERMDGKQLLSCSIRCTNARDDGSRSGGGLRLLLSSTSRERLLLPSGTMASLANLRTLSSAKALELKFKPLKVTSGTTHCIQVIVLPWSLQSAWSALLLACRPSSADCSDRRPPALSLRPPTRSLPPFSVRF